MSKFHNAVLTDEQKNFTQKLLNTVENDEELKEFVRKRGSGTTFALEFLDEIFKLNIIMENVIESEC